MACGLFFEYGYHHADEIAVNLARLGGYSSNRETGLAGFGLYITMLLILANRKGFNPILNISRIVDGFLIYEPLKRITKVDASHLSSVLFPENHGYLDSWHYCTTKSLFPVITVVAKMSVVPRAVILHQHC